MRVNHDGNAIKRFYYSPEGLKFDSWVKLWRHVGKRAPKGPPDLSSFRCAILSSK